MNTSLTLCWRNLWRHKRRTWLTVGAMVFSNVLLVFGITVQFGSYDMMIENSIKSFSGHVQIAAKGYQEQVKMRLVIDDIDALTQDLQTAMPELTITQRAATFVLAASEERSFGLQIAGVNIEQEQKVSNIPGLVKQGRYLRSDQSNEIVIGEVLARNLKVAVGDELTLIGSGLDGSFAAAVVIICGIFESNITELDRSLAEMSLADFQSVFAMQDAGHSIIANAPDIEDAENYQQQISTYLSAQGYDIDNIEVLNWMELNPGLQQAIKSDLVSSWFMYGVLIVLVAFSVLNTQLMSVLERTREFGIMTAIGLRSSTLGKLIILETSIMAALGLLLGVLFGAMVALYFNINGLSYPGMEDMAAQYNMSGAIYPSVRPVSILLGPMAIFIGCVLAAIYPVLRLRKIEPVTAMRAA